MAEFYRLGIALNPGSGTITVNGVDPVQYYEEGTTLNIAVTLDAGWVSIEWFGNSVSLSTATSFSVTMPSFDYRIKGVASGDFAPVDGYGLLFWSEFNDEQDANLLRLEIYKDSYGGLSTEIRTKAVAINFSDNTKKLTDTIVGCSLDFDIIGEPNQYDEFLTGDIRTFNVVLKRAGNIIFYGFLNPDFIEFYDLSGNQVYSFTAIDGLKGFDTFRTNPFVFPGGAFGVRSTGLSAVMGALNQTFVDQKKVNFICDIHEDRMDNTENPFLQFLWPEASIFTDGERTKFVDGVIIYNETTSLTETLESLLKPFLCRVFMWENEFWVIRVPDMYANSMSALRYLSNSDFDDTVVITNDVDVNCKISPKPRIRSGRVYTEFTALLNLGVFENAAKGAAFNASFGNDDWFVGSASSTYAGRYILRAWDYVNAIPSNKPSSVPSGDVALIQFASDTQGENCKIWTTTTTAGLSDPNLSSIYLTTKNTGVGFVIADELANTLSIELEFMVLPVGSSPDNSIENHSIAFQIKIGDYYLRESTTPEVYEFSLTVAQCVFDIPGGNTGVFNFIKITDVVIPTTDFVEVNLYQLICNSGDRHEFALSLRNFKLSIEENEALTLAQLGAKGITTDQYSSVFPDYETNIGDAKTNMSTSAIKLNITDSPVSELWTSNDVTSLPLLGSIVQDLANIYGRTNRIISGTIHNTEMKPYESFVYDGSLWIFINFTWNVHKNTYSFSAFELGLIPTT
jgi:hypothetical protein